MRIGEPLNAGRLIAASVASTTLPVQGPSMPPEVVTLAPDWSQIEARGLALQYATGLENGYTLSPRLVPLSPQHVPAPSSLGAAPAGEAWALEVQESIKASTSLMKHPLGVAGGVALIAGTIGGIVLREAGRQWDNDSLERIGKTIADVSGFASTLLRPDGRLRDGIVGGMVVTADLYGLARPGSKLTVDNAANALQWVDNFAAHRDTVLRTIAVGAPQLSLDPLVLPDP
jgi:hypothetical protein